MELPKNERVAANAKTKRKIWLYGAPFSGKTYLANQFPDILLLSTDGNYTQLPGGTPPHIDIKDVVTTEGRMTKRQFAWDVFKDVLSELEKKQNDFKTIVLDLIEDTYEQCRLYMYDQLGITHESDDSFRAWDKVRTEYLSTIKRLMNLDYENIILISHEDTTKDITKRSGDKITAIKPNLQDKAALKIAGMVDIVARIIAEDEKRIISFKNSEVIFGGGRLNVKANEIDCNYDELMRVYEEADGGKTPIHSSVTVKKITAKVIEVEETPKAEELETATAEPVAAETPEQPIKRTRKPREAVEEAPATVEEAPVEEAPRRTRRKRTEEPATTIEDMLPF